MNAFERLLTLSEEEKKKLGIEYTPSEIAQQPEMWLKTVDLLEQERPRIGSFLARAGITGKRKATLLLSGAGSSEYVCNCLVSTLRTTLQREVLSVPSTDFPTHPESRLIPAAPYVLVSFARSGDSPESLATSRLIKRLAPGTYQLAITCNRTGKLANVVTEDELGITLFLPEQTNDKSLAMTSSFSTMALAGLSLGFFDHLDILKSAVARASRAAERVLKHYGDRIADFAGQEFSRASYLGTDRLHGIMEECRLKMLEMSNGIVAANVNSYLGLRHGPQVFIDKNCVVIASLSSNRHRRRYEVDLLQELRDKKQGKAFLVICDRADQEIRALADLCVELFPEEDPLEDGFRVLTDVVVGQMLATFKSLNLGLKPDSPSAEGTISRVVQGVIIYDHE